MTKPVVVFDIDGVLCDFALGFSRLAATIFRFEPYTTADQVTWKDFRKRGLSYEDIGKVWNLVDHSEFWWETVPPLMSQSQDIAWMTLLSQVVDLHYVTNRSAPDNVGDQTRRWLSKHGYPEGDVHVVSEKAQFVQNTFSNLLGAIDDSPYNIEGYATRGLPLYVRDWQFNRDTCPELPRVQSVKEFCHIMIDKTND